MNKNLAVVLAVASAITIVGAAFLLTKVEKKQENKKDNLSSIPISTVMKIESSAFSQNQAIPSKYTCDGADVIPPLRFSEIPSGAQSLALIVDDPDSPSGNFAHWVAWNIPADTKEILEGQVPAGAVQGKNDFGKTGYGGPCPGQGTHNYVFNLYALDARIDLPQGSSREELENAMVNHILSHAQTIGAYKRK
jgi:Raf kinase inhibitor-like YbhB/YbcL family protein